MARRKDFVPLHKNNPYQYRLKQIANAASFRLTTDDGAGDLNVLCEVLGNAVTKRSTVGKSYSLAFTTHS